MSIYRLESRKASGEVIKQGTAWQLGTDLLVTAFHVVGDDGKWYYEAFQNATYHLIDAGEASKEPLQPLACDRNADIAVLKSPKPLPPSPLVLSEFEVVEDARWWADGFPAVTGEKVFRLTGKVAAVRSNSEADDLQLTLDQRTSVSWEGASGSAICVGGRVVGILTQEIGSIETVRAARTTPLRVLLERLGRGEVFAGVDRSLALPDWFVPRDWVVEQFARFMNRNRRGYFAVVADAGMGKTVLARDVARRFHAVAYYFNQAEGRTRSEQALESLARQLAGRYGLLAEGGAGAEALRAVLEKVPRGRQHVVLVVDAVDESDHWSGSTNPALLPVQLPDNVFVFLTHRPPVVRLQTVPGTPVNEPPLTIQRSDQHQRQAIRDYVARRVTEDPGIAARLRSESRPEVAEQLVSEVVARSEENFMYVAFVLDDVAREEEGELDWLKQLDRLPRSLIGYYQFFWNHFESGRKKDAAAWQEWEALYRPTLQFLVASREMVSPLWLAAFVKREAEEIETRVLRDWRRFLRVIRDSKGRESWGVLHQSFADYLIEYHGQELNLQDAHSRIADYYLTRWGGLEGRLTNLLETSESSGSDAYGLRHLAAHLEEAGRDADLHQLLQLELGVKKRMLVLRSGLFGLLDRLFRRPHYRTSMWQQLVWFAARDQLGDTAGFLADITRAWRLAEEAGARGMSPEERAAALVLQCRYALVSASIRSLATNQPPDLLLALVREGKWSPAKGLAYARQIPDERQRLLVMAKLGSLEKGTEPDYLQEALATAESIPDEAVRAEALADLAPYLPEHLLRKAISALSTLQWGSDITRAIQGLAPRLAELGYPGEALSLARSTAADPEKWWLLLRLARHLRGTMEWGQVLQDAIAAVRFARTSANWESILDLLAPHLSVDLLILALARSHGTSGYRTPASIQRTPSLQAPLIEDLLARNSSDDGERLKLLTRLMPHLPASDRSRIVTGVLESALSLAPERRVELLLDLAQYLEGPTREQILGDALSAAKTIERATDRIDVLTGLVSQLTVQDRAQVVSEVLGYVRNLSRQGNVLVATEFACALPAEDRGPVIHEALAGVRESDPAEGGRAWGLAQLVPLLDGHERNQATLESFQYALTDEDCLVTRAEVLVKLAAYVPSPERDHRLRQALDAVRAVEEPHWRAKFLAELAAFLPPGEQRQAFREALDCANTITAERERMESLMELVQLLPDREKGELLRAVVAAARLIRDTKKRCEVLASLVEQQPEEERATTWRDILTALRAIDDGWTTMFRLKELAPRLPAQFFGEAISVAKSIKSEDRVEAILELALHAPDEQRESALQETLEASRESDYEGETLLILLRLLRWLPSDQQGHVARKIRGRASAAEQEPEHALLLSRSISFLPANEQPAAFDKVFALVLSIRGEKVQQRELQASWTKMEDKTEQFRLVCDQLASLQVKTIAAIAGDLPEMLRIRLLAEGLKAISENSNSVSCSKGLLQLAPYLSESLVREALPLARRKCSDNGRALADLLARLAEVGFPEEALAQVRMFRGPWYDRNCMQRSQAVAMAKLTPCLPKGERKAVLEDALHAVLAIGDKNEERAAQARHHAAKGDYKLALALVKRVENSDMRSELLENLAPQWPVPLLSQLLRVYTPFDPQKIAVLMALEPRLRENDLRKALDQVRLCSGEYRVRGYALLLHRLSGWTRWWVRWEAIRAFLKLKRGHPWDTGAPSLALALATMGYAQQALFVALRCDQRGKAISNIAPRLPASLLDAAIAAAPTKIDLIGGGGDALPNLLARCAELEQPEKALRLARQIEDRQMRAWALRVLVPHLPKALLRQAWRVLKQIPGRFEQHQGAQGFALRFASLGYPELALRIARRIRWTDQPDRFVSQLIPHLDPPEAHRAVLSALKSARKMDNVYAARSLAGLARLLPERRRERVCREALAAAQGIESDIQKGETLIVLLSTLPESLLPDLLPLIEQSGRWRKEVVGKWAERLASLPPTTVYPVWCDSLQRLSTRQRVELLADLGALSPVLKALGGEAALDGVIQSIAQVCNWFH